MGRGAAAPLQAEARRLTVLPRGHAADLAVGWSSPLYFSVGAVVFVRASETSGRAARVLKACGDAALVAVGATGEERWVKLEDCAVEQRVRDAQSAAGLAAATAATKVIKET